MGEEVAVVIGAGALGAEVAERLSHDYVVVLADFRREPLLSVSGRVILDGGTVVTKDVDVRNRQSVRALAAFATGHGLIKRVVHSAGVSPTQALAEAIVSVDMIGTGIVIEEFEGVIEPGGSAVVVAGSAGHEHWPTLIDAQLEATILASKPEDLLTLPEVRSILYDQPDHDLARASAYGFAKRVNHLHVRAAAPRWKRREARINSVSPGDVDSIAEVVDFLLGDGSTFVTGIDLLVDGGRLAAADHPA